MKYCIHCGSEMSDEAEFCEKCGKAVKKVSGEKATKKPLIIGCSIGIVLVSIIVVSLFATGVFGGKNETEKPINEALKEIFTLSKEELKDKYEKQLINKNGGELVESASMDDSVIGLRIADGQELITRDDKLIECVSKDKYHLYIDNYTVQGLEGRLHVTYYEDSENTDVWTLRGNYGEIEWLYGFPKGKTKNDNEDEINLIIEFFSKLYGEAKIRYEDNYVKYSWSSGGGDSDPHYSMTLFGKNMDTDNLAISNGMEFSEGGIYLSYWGMGGERGMFY